MSEKMLRAIIWSAVSTKPQADEDKFSLEDQERQGRELCEREGWHIVSNLRVPGHSRNYRSLDKLASDASAKEIYAFNQLIEHLDKCDFDVLICRDADRFARKASLLHYIVECIVEDCGARIYSFMDGWIDATNADIFAMVKGYKTNQEQKWRKEAREKGFNKRLERGLPVNSAVVSSHKIIRNEKTGKAEKIVLDETRTQEWIDLASLIIKRVRWKEMEQAMFHQFGYCSPLGKPYTPHHYYRIVYTPAFWGNGARHFKSVGRGAWVREPGHDDQIPKGVLIEYGKYDPVYTGDLAQQVNRELERREQMRGKAAHKITRRFSGLLVCGECGYHMSYSVSPGWTALRCATRYEHTVRQDDCRARKYISEKKIQAEIDGRLRHAIALNDVTGLFDVPAEAIDTAQQLQSLEKQLYSHMQFRGRLIRQSAEAGEALDAGYRIEIEAQQRQIDSLEASIAALRHKIVKVDVERQRRAFEKLKSHKGIEEFWQHDDTYINDLLRDLMQHNRFVVLDGRIRYTTIPEKPTKRY